MENAPRAVAKFFITRKGVSKQMIGEYLGNLQNSFNMATLDFFIEELDFAGCEIDVALVRLFLILLIFNWLVSIRVMARSRVDCPPSVIIGSKCVTSALASSTTLNSSLSTDRDELAEMPRKLHAIY